MTFKGLRLALSVIGLAAYSLAAPSAKPVQAQRQTTAQEAQDTLADLATALMIGSIGRKTDLYSHNGGGGGQNHEPQHHHAISSLVHLLLTIGSAFAPLIGAIVGPLLTNIANGITWAVSHTIASGFSPPHGLFSPELGHGIKDHPTSYSVEGQPETGPETQQPADIVAPDQVAEPATVIDTRNEVKKP